MRAGELAAELEEAERSTARELLGARAERDFLVAELTRAVGLGGRDRRAASHAERARLNVTRAIRAAMANLARANPAWTRTSRPRSGPAGTAPTSPILAPRSAGSCDPVFSGAPLNNGASRLNATSVVRPRRKEAGCTSRWP